MRKSRRPPRSNNSGFIYETQKYTICSRCQFHQHFLLAFCANSFASKCHKSKMQLEKRCVKHFCTNNSLVKCWWNWHQKCTWCRKGNLCENANVFIFVQIISVGTNALSEVTVRSRNWFLESWKATTFIRKITTIKLMISHFKNKCLY